MKGITSTMPSLPPRPGTTPKKVPIGTDSSISAISIGELTRLARDERATLNSILSRSPGRRPWPPAPGLLVVCLFRVDHAGEQLDRIGRLAERFLDDLLG